jgi:hypothetical protein
MIPKRFDSISQRNRYKSHRDTNKQVVPWNNLKLHTLDYLTKNKKRVPIGKGLRHFLTEIQAVSTFIGELCY